MISMISLLSVSAASIDFCCCREFYFSAVKIHAYGVYVAVCHHDCSIVREKIHS